MSWDNIRIQPRAFGIDVLAALQMMCDHGRDGHRIQVVLHHKSDKSHGSEYRCANCPDISSFLFVKSATQSVGVQNFLMAKGISIEFKQIERKGQ